MNHPILEQLKREGADLPAERLEQLVALAALCLETYDIQQVQRRMEQDLRIFSSAISFEVTTLGHSEVELNYYIGLKDTELAMRRLVAEYNDDCKIADRGLLHAFYAAAVTDFGFSTNDPLGYLPYIFAQTGEYRAWDFRVSVDAAGAIQVEKREPRTRGTFDSPLFFGETHVMARNSLMPVTGIDGSGSSWRDYIERAQMRPNIWRRFDGSVRVFGSATISGESFHDSMITFSIPKKEVPKLPIIGKGDDKRVLSDLMPIERPRYLDKAKEVQIKYGTAWLDKKGKILFIDWH